MSSIVSFNGQNYIIPATGEVGWGSNVSNYLIAIAAGCLQKTGGSFTLSAETDFGGSFGLKSLYYKTRASNIASTGAFRLANAETGVVWRNAANSGDLALTVNSSNQLTFNGTPIESNALTNAHILVGNVSNIATDVPMSGDIGISNTGSTSIQSGVIVNSQINAAAAIAITKIAPGTANQIIGANSGATANEYKTLTGTANQVIVTNGSGTVTFSTPQSIGTTSTPTFGGLTLSSALTVANGGTGSTSFIPYSVILAGTTGTGQFTNLGTIGLSGQVLTSNGAGAYPSFQNSSGSGTVNSGIAGNLTLYPSSSNTVSDTYVQNSNNINISIASHATLASTRVYTIPDATSNASFVMTTGTQSVNGNFTFTGLATITKASVGSNVEFSSINTDNTSGSSSADLLIEVGGSSAGDPYLQFLIPSATVWTLGADNSDSDKFKISKSFTLGTTDYLTIDTSGNLVLTTGSETISATSNQLVLGATRTVTITAPTPATTSRTWTIPDITANGTFVALEGLQTFTGAKTFNATTEFAGVATCDSTLFSTNVTNASGVSISGTNTNDNAASGKYGEYISSTTTASTNATTHDTWDDLLSISLTAGDWEVTGGVNWDIGTATWSQARMGVSTTSGNTAPSGVADMQAQFLFASSSTTPTTMSLWTPGVRFSLSTTTTVYLKRYSEYSAGTPKTNGGRISARRMR